MTQRKQTTILPWDIKVWMLAATLLSLLYTGPACAEIEEPDIAEPEPEIQEKAVETHQYSSVQSGYRFITPDGPPAAAAPYGRLKSGVSGGFSAGTLGSNLKLTIDGNFLHVDEYHTELFFDYSGLVRFHAESGALWHNLPGELLLKEIASPTLTIDQRDRGVTYGVRTATSQAETRIKLGNNPFHFNLGYWELRRDGYEQLRFSDHYRSGASSIITEASQVDRVTREGTVGLDAHLGLFDLSYGFRIRDFSNEAADPRNDFKNNAGGTLAAGMQAHNVIPDNRVTSHTVKLYTNLSGGLVGSASYSLTQRENRGGHGETAPSENPSDVIHSAAGDLTYTPSKRHSFALKYRHREIDRSTPAALYYPYSQIPASPPGVYTATPGLLLIQPATSSTKDTLTISATFRPAPKVIYRLEYNADLETRTNIRNPQAPAGSPTAVHSDNRQTHTGTATFYWKPVTGIKVNATYAYAVCDNPAYVSSFSDQHIGKLLLTYTGNSRWGVSASYLAQYESGQRDTLTESPAPVAAYSLPRESRTGSGNASIWFTPLERLTVTTHYSYLEADINQSILFASIITDPAPLVVSNYHSSSHIYGIDAVYAVSEPLDISLGFQQVRSLSRFEVPDRSFILAGATGNFNTTGITDLTRLDTTETGVSARTDWRINDQLGCSLDYTFRRYESNQPIYNGSVHATMATLKARW